jgi:diadenylate cyclase
MEELLQNGLIIISSFWEYFRHVVDIFIMALIFYVAYSFLRNTRAIQLVKGIIIIIVVLFLSRLLRLDAVDWTITNFTESIVIALIILFQPELRRLITQFGQKNWLATDVYTELLPLDELVNAVVSMADEKIGSLIVIERNTGLKSFIESGVSVQSSISEELIRTIFFPLTPLHDGAIILQGSQIAAAACYLPLSDSRQLKKQHGARHRAGLGIAEETDALVIVTSEENGTITIMVNGKMQPRIKAGDLKNMILFFMNPKTASEEKYRIK